MYTRFTQITQAIYGRSWQAQLADYLMISRKTVSSWVDRRTFPNWAFEELKPLVARNVEEVKFAQDALTMSSDDFNHELAILNGETHHYDCDKYNIDDVKRFIKNQKWTVLQEAKTMLRNGGSSTDIKQWISNMFLSENDIADHLERNSTAEDDICDIQNMRGDACSDAISDFEIIFDKLNDNK
ncbi:bacteriophage CI repressor-like protein [Acinetobacter calcoaceticus]|uniref:Bacteriophage CI repressor-like protein n=1 Tax=Acinetobacter calcoaceticus TaxID=471 RepID=A0A4V2QZV8_ACICA|nr:bacteriophage CI repressor-like protein [Acinetobacter calcoaceticus]